MIKKLKNNKKIILLYLFTLIILAGANYLFYNYRLLKVNNDNEIYNIEKSDIKYKGFKEQKGKYISISDKSYIEINIQKYVNKLNFNYKTDNLVNLNSTELIDYNNYYGREKELKSSSTNYYGTNIYSKSIRKNVNKIKISFNQKDIVISNFSINNKKSFNFYTFIFFSVLFFDIYLLWFKRSYFAKNIEKGFLLISLSIGTLLVIIIPPAVGVSWDDQIHYKRTYEIFNFDGKRNNLVDEYESIVVDFHMFDTVEERKALLKYSNLNSYSDYNLNVDITSSSNFAYLLPSFMMHICNKLGIPFLVAFILGKYMYVLIYSFVMYYAIKIIPVHKHILTYIALIPTALFLSANYNYDNIVTPFLALAFSIFINEMYYKNKKLNTRHLAIFLISIALASFAKGVYAPFGLLLLLLPESKFENKKKYNTFRICLLIFCALIIFKLLTPNLVSTSGDSRGGDTSVREQIKINIKSPVLFVITFTSNVVGNFFDSMISKKIFISFAYLGSINKNSNIYFIFLIGFFYFMFTDRSKEYLTKTQKITIFILISFIICLIWGALYLSFTPIGETHIEGIQPRYFIPLLFPLIVLLNKNNMKYEISREKYSSILFFASLFVLYSSIYTVIICKYCF